MAVNIVSFAYSRPETQWGISRAQKYDVRPLPNPHSIPALRPLTGKHPDVQKFVRDSVKFSVVMGPILARIRDGDFIAFGCHGGIHRSVACAEILAVTCRERGFPYTIEHHGLDKS